MFELKDVASINLRLSLGSQKEEEFIEKLEKLSLSSFKDFEVEVETRLFQLLQELPRLTINQKDNDFRINVSKGAITLGISTELPPPFRKEEDRKTKITNETLSEASLALSFILGILFGTEEIVEPMEFLELIVSIENANCEGDFTYVLKDETKDSIKKLGEESSFDRVGISFVNRHEHTEYFLDFNFSQKRKVLFARTRYKFNSFSGTINLSRLVDEMLKHTRKVFADIGGV